MSLATLIIVSIFAGNAVSPVPQVVPMENMRTCQLALSSTMEGIRSAFMMNTTYAHRDAFVKQEKDWTQVISSMGRLVAQGKCESNAQ